MQRLHHMYMALDAAAVTTAGPGLLPQPLKWTWVQVVSLVGFGSLLRRAEMVNPTAGLVAARPTTIELWRSVSSTNLFLSGSLGPKTLPPATAAALQQCCCCCFANCRGCTHTNGAVHCVAVSCCSFRMLGVHM